MDGFYPSGTKVPNNSLTPSAALLKAVLLNSGRLVKGSQNFDGTSTASAMYDNNQGFGRVSLVDGLKLVGENTLSLFVVSSQALNTVAKTKTYDITIMSACTESLSATLVWTDPAGAYNAAKPLVNDLDIFITKNGSSTKTYPNGLRDKDYINNAERIRMKNLAVGSQYTITVTAATLAYSSQSYAVSSRLRRFLCVLLQTDS